MESRLLITPGERAIEELNAQAEAYLEELRAATQAAHERLRAGIMRLHPQEHGDEPALEAAADGFPPELDPIFATREFDVPAETLTSLVTFDDSP